MRQLHYFAVRPLIIFVYVNTLERKGESYIFTSLFISHTYKLEKISAIDYDFCLPNLCTNLFLNSFFFQ